MDGKTGMDLSGGPALSGVTIMGVALAAWLFGRWQGVLAAARDLPHPVPDRVKPPRRSPAMMPAEAPSAQPCQAAAREERADAFAPDLSLGELHAEITEYRRSERVLASLVDEGREVAWASAVSRPACRYIGLAGRPTCPATAAAGPACGCAPAKAAPPPVPARAVQPSAAAGALTRS
jgi:hypothetical protein